MDKLVKETLDFIADTLKDSPDINLSKALAIGERLLETFFDGDLLQYTKDGKNSIPFQQLLAADGLADLNVGHKTLTNYIRVYELTGRLPLGVETLGLAHRIKLLPVVGQPLLLWELAVEAVKKKWSARELEQQVTLRKKRWARGERSPTPTPSRAAELAWHATITVDQLRGAITESAPPQELQWAHDGLLGQASALEAAAEAIASKLAPLIESGAFKPEVRDHFAPNFDELMYDLTGERPQPILVKADEVLLELQRAGRRMKAALALGRWPEVDAWVRAFAKELAMAAGAEAGEPVPAPSPGRRAVAPEPSWFHIRTKPSWTAPENLPDDIKVMDFFDAHPDGPTYHYTVLASSEADAVAQFEREVRPLLLRLPADDIAIAEDARKPNPKAPGRKQKRPKIPIEEEMALPPGERSRRSLPEYIERLRRQDKLSEGDVGRDQK